MEDGSHQAYIELRHIGVSQDTRWSFQELELAVGQLLSDE